jgi:hypothetical protein
MLSRIAETDVAHEVPPGKHAPFQWRACFRGVVTGSQIFGACPESMAPNSNLTRGTYSSPEMS